MLVVRNGFLLVLSLLNAKWCDGTASEPTSSNTWTSSQWSFSTGVQQANEPNAPKFNPNQLLSLFSKSDHPVIDINVHSILPQNLEQHFDATLQHFNNQFEQLNTQVLQFTEQLQQSSGHSSQPDRRVQQVTNHVQPQNPDEKFNNQFQVPQFNNNQFQQSNNRGSPGPNINSDNRVFTSTDQIGQSTNRERLPDNEMLPFDSQMRQPGNQMRQSDNQMQQPVNQMRQSDIQMDQPDNQMRQSDNQVQQPANQMRQSFSRVQDEIDDRPVWSKNEGSNNQRRQPANQKRQPISRAQDEIDDRPVWGREDNKTFADPTLELKVTGSSGKREQTQLDPKTSKDDEEPWIPTSMEDFVNTRSLKYCLSYCTFPYGVGFVSGGTSAHIHEFPHMVALGYGSGSFQGRSLVAWNNCGGTLISKDYILTAAHCLDSDMGPPTQVRIGEHDLSRRDESSAQPVDFPILRIIVHPAYNATMSLYNDIALLQLVGTVNFTRNMRPACLHNSNVVRDEYNRKVLEPTSGVATGWGNTGFVDAPSDILQKVDLDIIDTQTCRTLLQADKYIPNGVQGDSQVCAGVLAGGRDTCQGDSGGPLQVNHTVFDRVRECPMEIVGIVSFGKICSQANSPGVYTRVAHYVPWIEDIVWPRRKLRRMKLD